MQKLTKTGSVQSLDWEMTEREQALSIDSLASGNWLVHIEQFISNASSLSGHDNIGIWLAADDDAAKLAPFCKQLKVVAVNFPAFTDGRGFSHARIIREQLGFSGELVATGGFMQDQLFYLKRCGFDSFHVADDADIDSMRASLQDFEHSYQAAADDPRPIFRKRQPAA